jgi:putative addiction module component (TIGR02574 family)
MARTVEEVRNDALALSYEDRATLAEELYASIGEPLELTPEYQAELERRVAEIDAGTAELVSVEDALASAHAAVAAVADAHATSSRR